MKILNQIICGDCLEVMKTLPSESIDMVMTSPPYWNLRDYGVEGQLGLEPTFQEYINKLCDIFDEVKRVLKKEGTCWVNMGDTYSGNKEGKTDNKVCSYLKENSQGIKKKATITEKCLCQIPSRFAIEMTNGGWILRNEIIWHKPNCMPSSVKDRFTVDFEKLFFFVKSKKYYFEQQFDPYSAESDAECRKTLRFGKFYRVKEPYKENIPYHKNLQEKGQANHSMHEKRINGDREYNFNSKGKNKRTVWTINTKPYKEAHFATYPKQLCVAPIRAGCPEKGIVLDPFFGSGTTALVAQELERNWIGIELNKEYIGIAKDRLKQKPLF